MISTDTVGGLFIDLIEENVIKPFLKRGKNSSDNTSLIEYISSEILNVYRVIPYEFYPYTSELLPTVNSLYVRILNSKLLPLIPIISNFDWNSYQYDATIQFDETITDDGSGTNFSMTETSPITAQREINTPNSKIDNSATSENTRTRVYTDPKYTFEKLKSINEFKYLLIRVDETIRSIFKEFNTIF